MRNTLRLFCLFGLIGLVCAIGLPAMAATPSGNDWFQILASPSTGNDNTGDGGTGNASDYNYYYVGQSFTGTLQINVSSPSGSNAANIWVDYATTTVSSTNLTTGSFFSSWASQTIDSAFGRVYSTGYRTSGYSSGLGNFGTANFSFKRPTQANYGTASPGTLDVNIGTVGNTTESNISYDGADILDDAEDFSFHVWADTKKPFAEDNSPASGTTGVAVDANYLFRLFDTKLGEGFSTNTAFGAGGVGTGVNTATPPGSIVFAPTHFVPTSHDAYSCSGIWGTNSCNVTLNPPSPSGIPSDSRNWLYNTLYSVTVSGYQDLASPSQDQLGDTNGPNTMDSKVFSFTTESDTVKPQVVGEIPSRGSGGNSASTDITVYVEDRKTYPNGPSGVGLDPATCKFNVSSPSFALTTYASTHPDVTVTSSTPSGWVAPFGYTFTINPATNFAENETVSVSAYDCADTVGNIMVTDNWTFSTADTQPPYVTSTVPSNDQFIAPTGTVAFHLKDDGVGVDLANTVIYVNGTYYTNTGGAGSVTVNGTRITFATSLNYNGGNYAGDTTSRSGTPNDYAFVIDPQANFAENGTVTVIVYSRDTSGNLMERVVYAMAVSVSGTLGTCAAGSSYCGANTVWNGSACVASGGSSYCGTDTSWNGSLCIGTGGGSASCPSMGGGGSSSANLEINISTVSVVQIDGSSALVSWTSNIPGTARVVYGQRATQDFGARPNYGYESSTPESADNSLYHAVVVGGLENGKLYRFRPLSVMNGREAYGPEVIMAPVYAGDAGELVCPQIPAPIVPTVASRPPAPAAQPIRTAPAQPTVPAYRPGDSGLKILEIENRSGTYYLKGKSAPSGVLKLYIY
jgi:hypothetical protein